MKLTAFTLSAALMATAAFAATPLKSAATAGNGTTPVDPNSPGAMLSKCVDTAKAEACQQKYFPKCTKSGGETNQSCVCASASNIIAKCLTIDNLNTTNSNCTSQVLAPAIPAYKLVMTMMCQAAGFPVDTAPTSSAESTIVSVSALVASLLMLAL